MYRTVAVRLATKKVAGVAGAKPGGTIADYIELSSTSSSTAVKVGSDQKKKVEKKDLAAAIAEKHDLNPIKSKHIVDTVFKSLLDVCTLAFAFSPPACGANISTLFFPFLHVEIDPKPTTRKKHRIYGSKRRSMWRDLACFKPSNAVRQPIVIRSVRS
jgi:hypothetical protein